MYTNNAYAMDGCATFFKRTKFSLVKKYEARPRLPLSSCDVSKFPPSGCCRQLDTSAIQGLQICPQRSSQGPLCIARQQN